MPKQDPMSEPDRQDRIDEALALLSRMTPAALDANRDELFFRAGEASARGALAAAPAWRQRVWPAIAATLALVATGLGYSLVTRRPEIQVVYVERPSAKTDKQAADIEIEAPPAISPEEDPSELRAATRYARNPLRPGPTSDMIHPQDWAALSDAFAHQLRLQQERSETRDNVAMAAAPQNDEPTFIDAPRNRPKTYLELRDALHAM